MFGNYLQWYWKKEYIGGSTMKKPSVNFILTLHMVLVDISTGFSIADHMASVPWLKVMYV